MTEENQTEATKVEETRTVEGGGEAKLSEQTPLAEQTAKTEEIKTEVQAAPLKFKVKVDEEEQEVDQEELVRGYQLAQASYKRFAEASQKQKDAQTIMDLFEKDPSDVLYAKFLKQANGDRDLAEKNLHEFGVKIVKKLLDKEALSPEQREVIRQQEELAEKERQIKAREEEIEREHTDRMAKQFEVELEDERKKAFESVGLDVNSKILAHRAYSYWAFLDQNNVNPDFKDIAKELKKIQRQEALALSNDLSQDEFETIYKDKIDAWHKKQVADLRGTSSTSQPSTQKGEGSKRRERPKEFRSIQEWSRWKDEDLSNSA